MAASFSMRDKWGLGAVAGVAACLGLGGWAYSNMRGVQAANTPLRPTTAKAKTAPASLDLAAGETKTDAANSVAPAPITETVVVHVTGCVKNPGVYKLHVGDRLNDAVHAAGGFKANAQQDALNLADTVRDADQICVPSRASLAAPSAKKQVGLPAAADFSDAGFAPLSAPRHALIVRGTPVRTAIASASAPAASAETESTPNDDPPAAPEPAAPAPAEPPVEGRVLGKPAAPPAETQPTPAAPAPVYVGTASKTRTTRTASSRKTSGSVSKSGTSAAKSGGKFKNPGDGIVHLNTASAAELEKLPGVGPAMSARILEYRHEIGGFKSVEQIMDVKGIGEKKYAKMQPFLAL